MNIHDLHFKKEILPLFDFAYNEFSRDVLVRLLSELPESVEEIYMRQQVLKGLLASDQLYTPFSYSKVEFNQVYGYIQDKKSQGIHLQGSLLKIHFLFAHAERSREKGGLSQLFIFLSKVENFYFSSLDLHLFPEEFKNRVENLHRMMTALEVKKYSVIARRRGFSIPELVRLLFILQEKISNGEMDDFWKDFFLFEAYFSISRGIKENHFSFPVFTDNDFKITAFYHPLLKNPVKNSLTAMGSVTLITGPNMSGKSTLLKAIGICVVLAQLGLAVPAERCELPFYDMISISINLNDDIKSGYSHFMTEIKTLKQVVTAAANGKRCFAIFDELFRGTNVEDALAISVTTILGLAGFSDSLFFISTHLHQLKDMIDRHRDKINTQFIECVLVHNQPVFTYRLQQGWSDLKIGQILFEQEGLNQLLKK